MVAEAFGQEAFDVTFDTEVPTPTLLLSSETENCGVTGGVVSYDCKEVKVETAYCGALLSGFATSSAKACPSRSIRKSMKRRVLGVSTLERG